MVTAAEPGYTTLHKWYSGDNVGKLIPKKEKDPELSWKSFQLHS